RPDETEIRVCEEKLTPHFTWHDARLSAALTPPRPIAANITEDREVHLTPVVNRDLISSEIISIINHKGRFHVYKKL
ncbi:hypothetical protein, partial [Serratia rubidaea]|uniref:hypothetical protein n=1 Tax=Serratia rubidaea TaxID=61652 RepID=UPI00137936B9